MPIRNKRSCDRRSHSFNKVEAAAGKRTYTQYFVRIDYVFMLTTRNFYVNNKMKINNIFHFIKLIAYSRPLRSCGYTNFFGYTHKFIGAVEIRIVAPANVNYTQFYYFYIFFVYFSQITQKLYIFIQFLSIFISFLSNFGYILWKIWQFLRQIVLFLENFCVFIKKFVFLEEKFVKNNVFYIYFT